MINVQENIFEKDLFLIDSDFFAENHREPLARGTLVVSTSKDVT